MEHDRPAELTLIDPGDLAAKAFICATTAAGAAVFGMALFVQPVAALGVLAAVAGFFVVGHFDEVTIRITHQQMLDYGRPGDDRELMDVLPETVLPGEAPLVPSR